MPTDPGVLSLIEQTPFVDTHEHLWEEWGRIKARELGEQSPLPAPDFGALFVEYAESDLLNAGMTREQIGRLHSHDMSVQDKWMLLVPHLQAARHTGYLQGVRETVRQLFGVEDLRGDNVQQVSDGVRDLVKPGYYAHVLKKIANVEHVQVNGLDHPVFVETEQPALLCQDLSTVKLATELDVPALEKVTGLTVRNLTDWHGVIDWCFAKFGPRAIAVKNQSAYTRRLNYAQVGADEVTAAFKRYLAKPTDVRPDELKAIEDHLFHLTVTRATEHRLPVKLHTGQYMGNDWMPLRRVRDNISDLCPVVQAHPEAEFVIMHMGYPYQDELISFAKHHTNVWVDLCWAWIINPAAAVRFVKEFLMAVPSNRLLTFGGDHFHVELVTGHARLARRGLALALSELVGDRWIARQDVEPLVERLMRGNANALFDYEGTLANWGPQA